jgi:quercetin dioxygenase-like cupin family protein
VTPPDANGTVIRIVDLAPRSRSPMHRTQSLDYAIVLSGTASLVLDDGSETVLRPGDVVIQRGTDHAWVNKTDEPARMAFVLVDGRFTDDVRARLPVETKLFDDKLDP